VERFFARKPLPARLQLVCFLPDLSGLSFDQARPSLPAVSTEPRPRLCTGLGGIAARYSLAQFDQGIWAFWARIFGSRNFCAAQPPHCSDEFKAFARCTRCFSDFGALSNVKPRETGFYLWWDLILFALRGERTHQKKLPAKTYQLLSAHNRTLLDTMFQTIVEIL